MNRQERISCSGYLHPCVYMNMCVTENATFDRPVSLPADHDIAVFDVNAPVWDQRGIRYTRSLCRSTDEAGSARNPSVHGEMHQHLKRHHGIRGFSTLRSERFMDDPGAIAAIEFVRT